jgi:hypothetical protein
MKVISAKPHITRNYDRPFSWPHRLSLKRSLEISCVICFFEAVLLVFSAYLDGTLRIAHGGVGLLQHPGIFSILFGDIILFGLSTYCARLTSKVGVKLPNREPRLVRRYYQLAILRRAYLRPNYFLRLFGGFAVVGLLALVNQTVKLFDPTTYYGHDTFDAYKHIYSFVANRINLFISWCLILPLFATYLVIHIVATNRTVRLVERKRLLLFNVNHPDRSGGFAFFGFVNTLFMLGLVTIFAEIFLLVYTHDKITFANVLAMLGTGVAVILISYYSIYAVERAIKRLEVRLKIRPSIERARQRLELNAHVVAIVYQINFSAYNLIATRSMFALRAISILPAIIKLYQYSRQFT